MPKMNVEEIEAFYAAFFQQRDRFRFNIEEVADGGVRIRLLYHELYLRPGGTISGPALMALADSAMYSLRRREIFFSSRQRRLNSAVASSTRENSSTVPWVATHG